MAEKITLPRDYRKLSSHQRRATRLAYVKQQQGRCSHCKQPLDGEPAKSITTTPVTEHLFPPGFFNNPVHLHHNHQTGMTIGAVHARCNAVLWQYHHE